MKNNDNNNNKTSSVYPFVFALTTPLSIHCSTFKRVSIYYPLKLNMCNDWRERILNSIKIYVKKEKCLFKGSKLSSELW